MLRAPSGARLLPCSHTCSQPDVKQVFCWHQSLAHPYLLLDLKLLFRRHAAACYSSWCCSTPATIATQQPARTQLSAPAAAPLLHTSAIQLWSASRVLCCTALLLHTSGRLAAGDAAAAGLRHAPTGKEHTPPCSECAHLTICRKAALLQCKTCQRRYVQRAMLRKEVCEPLGHVP
jgi:hypothetical protein